MASRSLRGTALWFYAARVAAARCARRKAHGDDIHLHALFKSTLVQAAHPLRRTAAALQSRWPTASR
eukprot:7201057-Prymnesium_polylepis.2